MEIKTTKHSDDWIEVEIKHHGTKINFNFDSLLEPLELTDRLRDVADDLEYIAESIYEVEALVKK